MRIAIFAGILAAATSVASASPLLVGTDNDGNGSFLVGNQSGLYYDTGNLSAGYANIGWAQSFTLTDSILASDVRVWAKYDNVPSTYELQITNQIGAGTTSANVLFDATASYSDTYSWKDFNLDNLALGPGTYYLVMTSATSVPEPALDGSDCRDVPDATHTQTLCYVAGNWGSDGTNLSNTSVGNVGDLFLAIGGFDAHDAPARLLTDFDPTGGPNGGIATFQLNGTVASATAAPEPGTMILLGGAGLLMAFTKRRLIRNR